MFFRKNRRIVLCALVAALLLGGCGGSTRDYEGEIQQLKRENVALDTEVRQLREEVARLRLIRLDSWHLEGWGESRQTPAVIRFSARPLAHEEEQRAELLVLLEGREVLRRSCGWDGERFTAEITLDPADGYGYYCVLTGQDGTEERIPLSTPEEPREPKLTFLYSSLRLEANAVLKEIRLDRRTLTADVVTAVQMPLLTRESGPVTPERGVLQWLLDGGLLEEVPVELVPGQTQGSFSGRTEGVQIVVPKMASGSSLELRFSVSLSDGRELTAPVGSWTMNGRELIGAVG